MSCEVKDMKKIIISVLLLVLGIPIVSAESIRSDKLISGFVDGFDTDGIQIDNVRSHLNLNFNENNGNIGIQLVGKDASLRVSAKIISLSGYDRIYNRWFYATGNYLTIKKNKEVKIIDNPIILSNIEGDIMRSYIFSSQNGNIIGYSSWRISS